MLPQLYAEEQLASIEAATVPHMTQEAARDVLRRHQNAIHREPVRPSLAELEGLGIRVTRKQVGP